MKDRDVLREYADGRRNFHENPGLDLHGQSFFKKNLSGADFTGANIKQTNFTGANLEGANFTRARAGIQNQHNSICFGIITSGIQTGLIFATLFFTGIAEISNLPKQANYLIIAFIISLIAASCIIIARLGFTAKSFLILATAIFTAFMIVVSGFSSKISYATGAIVIISGVLSTFATTVSIFIFAIITFFYLATGSKAIITSSIFTSIIIFLIAMASGKITGYYGFYNITAFIIYDLFGYYCGYHASKDNNDFMIIRTWGILMVAQNGTSFRGADLTGVIFEKAILHGTDFDNSRDKKTTLNKIIWKGVQGLDYANFASDSILINSAVRNLLVTRNGYGKSYVGANLQSANLDNVDLENADLTRANIFGATLRDTRLINANLNESTFLSTDLTGAHLTGVCIEAWNFDSHTKLNKVTCEYVYLLRNKEERYPSSGEFDPGDFTKLFQKVLDTVDLIFHNDVDRQAVGAAIREVKVKYGNVEIKVCSVEDKNGLLIVRVNVPPDINKEEFHRLTMELYLIQGQLLQANNEISYYRSKPMSNNNQPFLMINSGNNASNIIQGSGDIRDNINKINQLPDTSDPNQPNIKELLIQLQAAVETEPTLPETDKSDLLEQVQKLAEAKQTKELTEKEGLVRKAKKIFEATLKGLPDTAKIVEACSKLLPLILKALGSPI